MVTLGFFVVRLWDKTTEAANPSKAAPRHSRMQTKLRRRWKANKSNMYLCAKYAYPSCGIPKVSSTIVGQPSDSKRLVQVTTALYLTMQLSASIRNPPRPFPFPLPRRGATAYLLRSLLRSEDPGGSHSSTTWHKPHTKTFHDASHGDIVPHL